MTVLSLLLFAAGFALGLFFGWLLHRERVERALYEDVVRARDRATSTLAETSARLELANRDAVRLREQLTDAQHELTDRDATIARLRREAEAEPSADGSDAAAGGFDEAEVTEEVVPTSEFLIEAGAAAPADELVDHADEDLELVDDAVVEAEVIDQAEEAAVVDEGVLERAGAVEDEVVDEAELAVVDEPTGAEAEGTEPVDGAEVAAAERVDVVAELPDDEVEDDDELVAAGTWYDREPVAGDAGAPAEVPAAEAADADVHDAQADDLRRIAGIGPALERALHSEGITTFRALAQLDDRALAELGGRRPRLVTRLRRDDWVAQARRLQEEARGTTP
jgi:predicted flap endonuclease-1-like 5' DNA nuclease